MFEFFKHGKGNGALAGLISFCKEEDMPAFIKETVYSISKTMYKCDDLESLKTAEETE